MQDELLGPREPQFETQEGQHPLIPQAIIVDLDSTLALLGSRSPHDYDSVMEDKVNGVVYRLIMKYKRDNYKILIVTGRPISCADNTMAWLNMNHIPCDLLVMRPHGEKSPDYIVKHKIYEQFIEGKYDVELVLEDRTRVVKRWREIGLTCFQVKEGDY